MAETKPKQNQKSRKIPERRCVGCVGTFPKKDLIRVVRSPEGEISIDFTGKKSGILKRSLECEISEEIYTELEKEIRLAEAENE